MKEKIAKVSLIAMWVAIATAAPLRIAVADEAAPVAAPAAAAAPTLPAYFSGTNADPAKPTWPDPTGAATGVWATPAGDGKGDVPSSLSIPDLYDRIAHNLFSINFVWTLVTGFLVMFMQAGFMLVETGLCRSKNAAHTAAMNFMIYPLGCLAFWAYGFAIGWGNWFNGPVPPGWYAVARTGHGRAQRRLGPRRGHGCGRKRYRCVHLRPDRAQGLLP